MGHRLPVSGEHTFATPRCSPPSRKCQSFYDHFAKLNCQCTRRPRASTSEWKQVAHPDLRPLHLERRSIPFSQVLHVIFPARLAGHHFPHNRLVLCKRALVSSPDNQYSVSLDDCMVSYGSACCGPDVSCITRFFLTAKSE